MATTAAKKTAAKPTTTETEETETKVSPIKTSTVTYMTLEVEDVEYKGSVELSDEQMKDLEELAIKQDEARAAYAESTKDLLEMLEELGIEPEKPKKNVSEAKLIRRWARRMKIDVNAQGAIPGEIREKYEAAKKKGELEADEF